MKDCEPMLDDPDVGILSCDDSQYCSKSADSTLGGFCSSISEVLARYRYIRDIALTAPSNVLRLVTVPSLTKQLKRVLSRATIRIVVSFVQSIGYHSASIFLLREAMSQLLVPAITSRSLIK